MTASVLEFPGIRGSLRVEPLDDGRHRISVLPADGRSVPNGDWVTSYPLPLVLDIHATKDVYVCDEIMRDENPTYVERSLRNAVLGYVEAAAFAGRRVLDFGCGSGASLLVLSRILPPCEIVGVEIDPRLIDLARRRAQHFGLERVRVLQSPSPESLPSGLGKFDFAMFSAVFEHLRPHERRELLPLVWQRLRPGGVLFLNQTPHRYWPIETHTTSGLPLINYLPDSIALAYARRFSRRVAPGESWHSLLRRGIRGGTVREIMGILGGPERAELLAPQPHIGDRIDLWYRRPGQRPVLKKTVHAVLKAGKLLSGFEIVPTLSLAIRKVA
jgi:SAM-dependent methyltransferase